MKRSKLIFLSAGLIAVCFAFTTRAHVNKMPAAYVTPGCSITTKPTQCSGGTTICTIGGRTYYSDMFCTSPLTMND